MKIFENDKINDKIKQKMFNMIETEFLELRESLAQGKEGIISLSAMLNKGGYGELYFGINDDGKVFGLTMGKKILADVTHEIQNHLKPLPNKISVLPADLEGKKVIRVVVKGHDTPYSAYGRYYIRVNDADILMDANQLKDFFEAKEPNYSKWENAETPYGVDDIKEEILIGCIRDANDKGRLDYVYRNAADALTRLGLLTENGHLNNAGWYLFGSKGPLIIKEANFPTDSRTEFGQIKEFKGNIFECIAEAMAFIGNGISFKSNIVGIQREDVPEIPIRAIREIVVNSFAHCSYAIEGDFNQYTIYRSFLKVYNPGGIFEGIDPIKFASGYVGSKIRNVLIASVLFKCGYIDSFGTGFDRTFDLCSKDGVGYRYQNDKFGFTFVFDRKVDWTSAYAGVPLDALDQAIIKELKLNKYCSISELAGRVSKSPATIYRHLESLESKGVIKRVGSRKTGYWNVL